MNRRIWMMGGVAAAAGVAGLWWKQHRPAAAETAALPIEPAPVTAAAAASADPAAAAADFWSRSFERPDGSPLPMAGLRGKPLVVNFWATWCPPCVKEMPELDRFSREFGQHGWQVIGIAVDSKTPVSEFLKKTPVSFPIGLAGFAGTELARLLGNSNSALPFTVVFDASGRITQRKLGQTSYVELAGWASTRG